MIGRLLHVVVRLLERYATEARREASRDLRRLSVAVGGLALAGTLTVHAITFAHALLVLLLVDAGLRPTDVVVGVLLMDAAGAVLLFVSASWMLARPILPTTRARVASLQQAVKVLTG